MSENQTCSETASVASLERSISTALPTNVAFNNNSAFNLFHKSDYFRNSI